MSRALYKCVRLSMPYGKRGSLSVVQRHEFSESDIKPGALEPDKGFWELIDTISTKARLV